MKTTSSLYGILLLSTSMIARVSAAWGWGSSTNDNIAATNEVEINETAAVSPTFVNSQTLETIIHKGKRFVLFNSRRLTGECLPICLEDPLTKKPSDSPTSRPIISTLSKDPTKEPTANPTDPMRNPIDSPTLVTHDPTTFYPSTEVSEDGATHDPTTFSPSTFHPTRFHPTADPTDTEASMEECLCQVNTSEREQSWKCGNYVYVCPNVDTICSTQGSKNSKFYSLSKEQCNTMKSINIGQKCIILPEYGITNPKSLSNRVCYQNGGLGSNGMKQDAQSCDICSSTIQFDFERTKNPTESPTLPIEDAQAAPTDSPTIMEEIVVDPTDAPVRPTAPPTTRTTVDPGSFCRQPENCNLKGPGQCQIVDKGGAPSCGAGVPVGYYPDLSRCDAYCFCTGTEAPSRYEIIDNQLEWDTHQQGPQIEYLSGVYGRNGAWGTNGGAQGWPWQMSSKGRQRPPGCGGPTCPNNKTQPWDNCKKYYTCNGGNAGPITSCGPGTLFDTKLQLCNHASLVKCG